MLCVYGHYVSEKDVHIYKMYTIKRRIEVLEFFYYILLLSSTLDAFRVCCHRQENEFFQVCMPFYSLFSGQVTLMRSHGLKRVM